MSPIAGLLSSPLLSVSGVNSVAVSSAMESDFHWNRIENPCAAKPLFPAARAVAARLAAVHEQHTGLPERPRAAPWTSAARSHAGTWLPWRLSPLRRLALLDLVIVRPSPLFMLAS